ncbi:hypothetical protein ABT282_08320 [Streptomyces sp. NPDC000927]|uniref:hypothetical protein n=1 Tax=Streptomyces sp. NPDC000927 TaxID=3154371 RepID=UPI003330ABE5
MSVRIHTGPQFFELCTVNDTDAFFRYCPIHSSATMVEGERIEIYAPTTKGVDLSYYSQGQRIDQARLWFNSVWESIGRDLDLNTR